MRRSLTVMVLALVASTLLWPAVGAAAVHRSAPSCGRYCRNAGGFGGVSTAPAPRMKLLAQRVQLHGHTVSLPLLCQAQRACRGALLLNAPRDKPAPLPSIDLARSDLFVPAHTEWLIVITLSRSGLAYLHAHHRVSATLVAVFKTKDRRVNPQRDFAVKLAG